MSFYKKYILTITIIIISALISQNSYSLGENSSKINNIKNIEKYSSLHIGKPYINSPLGEGKFGKIDKDPLYRTDAFDCLTYIETVIAQSITKSQNKNDIIKTLNKIRYNNNTNPTFTNRNHFVSLDWFPNNSLIVQDITINISKEKSKLASIIIDKQSWFLKNHNINTNIDKQTASIAYIPFKNIKHIVNIVPNYSIITIVRQDPKAIEKIGTNMNVAHHGFFVKNKNNILFRHASQKHRKIIDEPFLEYMQNYSKKSGALGINITTLK